MRGRGFRPGFTILETMLAIAYLMTCLVFLFSFFSSSGKNTMDSYHESMAYLLAQEGLDLVSGAGFDALTPIAKKPPDFSGSLTNFTNFVTEANPRSRWVDDDGISASYPKDYEAFDRVITVEFFPDKFTISNLICVTVEVTLPEGLMRKGKISLKKLVGKDHD